MKGDVASITDAVDGPVCRETVGTPLVDQIDEVLGIVETEVLRASGISESAKLEAVAKVEKVKG